MAPSSADPATKATDALANSLSGLVIAASGNIPGKKHREIKKLVQKYGGKYEAEDVTDCTHLITTSRNLNTQKVQEARGQGSCQIVSINWLIKSMEKLKPVGTKKYLLKFPKPVRNSTGEIAVVDLTGGKRKLDNDDEQTGYGTFKKLKFSPPDFDRWAAVVDEKLGSEIKTRMVWVDDEGLWDATLVKESSHRIQTRYYYDDSCRRVQLLFNVQDQTYYTHVGQGNNAPFSQKGNGDLESAQVAFRQFFEQATGLSWKSRDKDPIERCYIFVDCRYEHDAASSTLLSPLVLDVLKMVFNSNHVPWIQNIIYLLSQDRFENTEHTMRVAIAILDRICKLSCASHETWNADQLKLVLRLTRCYSDLTGNKLADDAGCAQKESDALCFLRTLTKLKAMLNGPSKLEGNELLYAAYKRFHLPQMIIVKKDTLEHQLLAQYFTGSISRNHYSPAVINIFRVERAGEAERLDEWTKANKSKAGERRLLWHGSQLQNFIGILSQGLCMNAYQTKTGQMYDIGIYFADMAGKSVRFCRTPPGTMALVLLCEVEVGHTMATYTHANYEACSTIRMSKQNCAVFAEGRVTHKKWCDAEWVHPDLKGIWMPDVYAGTREKSIGYVLLHNEFVVYDAAQVRQRYLFQVRIS